MVCAYDSQTKSMSALGFEIDDEGEQLFSVKQVDIEVPEGFGKIDYDQLTSTSDKTRTITREEEVKKKQKLARKANVSLNTKIVFEEGKEESDEDDKDEKKGLNIELAKKRMQEADVQDKQNYREMIKLRKREEKIKLKEKRKAELEEMRKRLAAEEGEDDEEVEIVYHKDSDNNSDNEPQQYSDQSNSDDDRPRKKKFKPNDSDEDQLSGESGSDEEEGSEEEGSEEEEEEEEEDVSGVGASLPDDEQLALRLLQKYS
ncbi:hypothetical protein LOTGIDRAFT_221657 [Lottia gigantea]|uniref:ELM2 domain-containing protein n=1 Tax=Lottia gigantea TaxID=225164 RepID=V3ZL02_LOTGI|nr:hypothetical protein LOTGIDRAFT_221657 [Lottia gigantea]ESO84952.1 hypothetical protein LOTGIDRAFT_221657 [Lottia gigantea]